MTKLPLLFSLVSHSTLRHPSKEYKNFLLMGDMCLEGDKSVTQQANDTLSGKPGEKGIVEQVQDTATSAAKYVQDTANGTLFLPSTDHHIHRFAHLRKQC